MSLTLYIGTIPPLFVTSKIPQAINLKCEYLVNPLGLDVSKPRFSWVIPHYERGRLQSAYRIIVSAIRENIEKNIGDMWDSGKVESSQSVNVEYGGKELKSKTIYYWKVKWWDDLGRESPFSEVAFFETGIFKMNEWKARWITGGRAFKKEFEINSRVVRARAYIVGLGYYVLKINGRKVGDRVLDPPWTDYDKLAMYSVYDVTEYIKTGKNVVTVFLGNGRYSQPHFLSSRSTLTVKKFKEAAPKFSAEILICFEDGEELTIASDESWIVVDSPITFDDIYDGEIYDARIENSETDQATSSNKGDRRARVIEPPCGELRSSNMMPPVRKIRYLPPRAILNPKPGVYVFDFGQNFSGWVKLKVRGARGTEVRIRYSELINTDGTLNTMTNREAKATDIYILKGEDTEIYEPSFTYHGFRYVELTGFPGTPNLDTLTGVAVHSDVEQIGGFACSNQLLNDIHKIAIWSMLSNIMSVPTDCPQRDERMGWMGDAALSAEALMLNFDMAAFFNKWLRDMRLAQAQDGSVPDVVPPYWILYPADPAWGSACVIIPWLLYLYYNDKRALEENYEMMKRWVEFLKSRSENNILMLNKYGDWCRPGFIAAPDTPVDLISTWYYYYCVKIVSDVASILGKKNESDTFRELAERIKISFNDRFLYKEGRYGRIIPASYNAVASELSPHLLRFFGDSSQTSNVLPLFLDLVPHDCVEKVLDTLVEDIIFRRDYHLATGIIGTRYILETLSKYGKMEVAYKIASQSTYPSWGYMIREGATTLWERWEPLAGGGMNSHNHHMFGGGIESWFFKVLAGINVRLDGPGFEKILIKPHIIDDLNHVSASIYTVRGLVYVQWFKEKGEIRIELEIPVNSAGEIHVPVKGIENPTIIEDGNIVWKDGRAIESHPSIRLVRREGEDIILEVGSGSYLFVVKPSPNTQS